MRKYENVSIDKLIPYEILILPFTKMAVKKVLKHEAERSD